MNWYAHSNSLFMSRSHLSQRERYLFAVDVLLLVLLAVAIILVNPWVRSQYSGTLMTDLESQYGLFQEPKESGE